MIEPIKDTYDASTGRVEGKDDIFADPPAEETPPADQGDTTTPPDVTPPGNGEVTPENKQGDNEPTKPEIKVEEIKTKKAEELSEDEKTFIKEHSTEFSDEEKKQLGVTTETPKLFAGKYNTVDELKVAYQNLGGDPARFSSDAALEEAYEFRNAEFTRVSQENAERERLAIAIEANKKSEPKDPTQVAEEMLGKIDWTKVTDAKTLTKQLLPILLENAKSGQQNQMTEEQIVDKVIPMIKDREQRTEALHSIEMEVPRLSTDQVFRKQFALHVVGGQKNGVPYPKTKEGLQLAMKDFLSFSQSMVEAASKQKEKDAQIKRNAQATPDGGGSVVIDNGNKDEADEIIGAFAEKQRKFNFI